MQLCGGEQAVLPKPALLTGTRSLLTNMALDDIMSDAPKAADWVSIKSCLHGKSSCSAQVSNSNNACVFGIENRDNSDIFLGHAMFVLGISNRFTAQ